jgi:hypothetical protein
MSLDISAGALGRTTNLPANCNVCAFGCWAFITQSTPGDYALVSIDNGNDFVDIANGSNGYSVFTDTANQLLVTHASALNKWVWVGFSAAAGGTVCYVSTDGGVTLTAAGTITSTNAAPNLFGISKDGFGSVFFPGFIWAPKFFTTTLTAAQMQNEMLRNRPLVTPNTWLSGLDGTNPGVDFSGNGGNMTTSGSLAGSTQNPPIPWKG